MPAAHTLGDLGEVDHRFAHGLGVALAAGRADALGGVGDGCEAERARARAEAKRQLIERRDRVRRFCVLKRIDEFAEAEHERVDLGFEVGWGLLTARPRQTWQQKKSKNSTCLQPF